MTTKYFKITPLESRQTYIVHKIISLEGEERSWVATQIIGSQVGFRNFDNPIKRQEVDSGVIYSDPDLSGYQFDDEFDYIAWYDYSFDDSFDDEEQELLISQYEGGTGDGIGAGWLSMGDHNWGLDGQEMLLFKCPIKIDLINEKGEILEEDIQPL